MGEKERHRINSIVLSCFTYTMADNCDSKNDQEEETEKKKKKERIVKLRVATEEASIQVKICNQEMEKAHLHLAEAKYKYRVLNDRLKQQSGDELMMNDTELPELIEQHTATKNAYETAHKRYETNKRYLELHDT